MKPALPAALLALAVAFAAAVLTAAEPAGKARAVAPEPVADLGRIAKGEQIEHDFVIRNEGGAPLGITEVDPACGCTVAEYDRSIPAGGEGKLHAVVDTASFRGPIAKAVTVYTDDPQNPSINLVIKAIIEPYIEVSPGYARFVLVEGEQAPASVQTIWSEDRSDLEVLGVTSPYPFLKAEVHEAAGAELRDGVEGKQWRLTLAVKPDAAPGPLADHVRVRTNHPRQPELLVPVSGTVRPLLAVLPPVADFGRREVTEPFKASLEIRNNSSADIDLTSARSDLDGLEALLTPLKEGKHYQLEVTLQPSMPKGDFHGQVTIETTSSRQPLLQVKVKGTIL